VRSWRSFRYLRFFFGARCERALAAAVLDFDPVLLLRRTAEAALAAFADVFRFRAIRFNLPSMLDE
jgi:hypothetical protein